MRDSVNNIHILRCISPTRVSDNTVQTSQIIHTQGYQGLAFAISTGTLADANATFKVEIQDSATQTGSDFTAVASEWLILKDNIPSDFTYDDDNRVSLVGYIGHQPYVRVVVTPSANTGNADISIDAHQSFPEWSPTSL